MKISIGNYGQYSSPGQGAHTIRLDVDDLSLYFSYQTIVAFSHPSTGLVVSENVWSTTTGKHIGWIIKHSAVGKIQHGYFQERLEAMLNRMNLEVG